MNLKLLNLLPDDIINLIYEKIYFTQSKELLQDIKNYKLSKNRIYENLSIYDIYNKINNIEKIKFPKFIFNNKFINDYINNIKLIINLFLAKNKIEKRNKIVYLLLIN